MRPTACRTPSRPPAPRSKAASSRSSSPDDDSPDRTWEVAERLGNPHVRVLRRTENRGLAAAAVDAFGIAKGERLGVMDADGQHDEAILPQMLDALEQHEFVIGSRAAPGGGCGDWSLLRRFASWSAAQMARTILGVSIRDPMAGYFALRRDVFDRAKPRLEPKGWKIMLELFCLGRPSSFTEIGYVFRPRRAGESKLSAKVMREYLSALWNLRRRMRERS